MFVLDNKNNPIVAKKKNIYELADGKILTCKKDIVCKEGSFKKYSSVFPIIVNYKITALYDLREWTGAEEPSEKCPVGTLKSPIVESVFDAYFEVNENASVLYGDVTAQKALMQEKESDFKESINACIEFGFLMLAVAACLVSENSYLFLIPIIASFLSFISAQIVKICKTQKFKCLYSDFNTVRDELLIYVMDKERYSGCDDDIIKSRENLIALAQNNGKG